MTTPTTPKAGDITEEILEEFDSKFTWMVSPIGIKRGTPEGNEEEQCILGNPVRDFDDHVNLGNIKDFIAQALAKQKESIKEQLRMKRACPVQPGNHDDEVTCWGYNQAVYELDIKLDNL